MHLAGSPRRIETAGDAQPYTMFFYSHNATASLIENDNRLRAMVDLFNTPAIGPDGGNCRSLRNSAVRAFGSKTISARRCSMAKPEYTYV